MSRQAEQKIDFGTFLALWNKAQEQSTPALHFKMADWLETAWQQGRTRLLLQAFRSCGKSTVTGLFAAWLLYRQPDMRILVLAADMMLARKMVRNVKRLIERHPLTQHLRPDRIDQWGADRFTVRRTKELRDPSMLARGITANITGSRADVIICDDVEVPKTCDTAQKRADLRERLDESAFVLTPGGTQLYIGTPHTWYTIYADAPRCEIGEERAFLDGYDRLSLPLLDETGQSLWPDRYTPQRVDKIRRAAGPRKFSAQMMLQPVNIAEGRLDPALMERYDAEINYIKEINLLQIGDHKMVAASAWWDPAFGAAGGDGSVLAVVYTDDSGCYWLHRLCYLKTGMQGEEDEATAQCRQVAQILKSGYVPVVGIEINGIGRFLPAILRRELARAHVGCAVREISHARPKDERILEAFDVVLAARMLRVHGGVYDTPFMREMQEWRPGLAGGRDDGLDAVAGALAQQPVRIRRHYHDSRQSWQGGGTINAHRAKTEFEV